MDLDDIRENTRKLLAELPEGVTLVAAGKTRTPEELRAAVEGGVRIIGHNYVQEAERCIQALGREILSQGLRYHCIGHIQRNKAKKAAPLFDMIETVDNMKIASALDRACADLGKVMPVLVEVNSAEEENKAGVLPADVETLVRDLSALGCLRVEGLMTMGPWTEDPEEVRPYLRRTKELFDQLSGNNIPNVRMRHLSMGMSDSYLVAIEEGASMVRIGTRLFGPR
jgi:pyridoxal phosphate enzyme (YggS family)